MINIYGTLNYNQSAFPSIRMVLLVSLMVRVLFLVIIAFNILQKRRGNHLDW